MESTSPGSDSRFTVMAALVETCHIDKKVIVTRQKKFSIHQSRCPNTGVDIFALEKLEYSAFVFT